MTAWILQNEKDILIISLQLLLLIGSLAIILKVVHSVIRSAVSAAIRDNDRK